MGFFSFEHKHEDKNLQGISPEFLHRGGCSVCPLNKQPRLDSAVGSTEPIVYVLGEAPGSEEIKQGIPFVGRSGTLLRANVPKDWLPYLRWNNCVRSRPPDNRTPTAVEIECCRPSVEADIETTKPKAIFGFGAVPLQWALRQSGIIRNHWTHRYIPIKVGNHTCWFFPMVHPSYVLREKDDMLNRYSDKYRSNVGFTFAKTLEWAFSIVESLPEAVVHTPSDAFADIEVEMSSVDRITEILDEVAENGLVGIDYETSCLRPYEKDAKILTVALSTRDKTYGFPLHHPATPFTKKQVEAIDAEFSSFLHYAKCRKISHHLGFELEWSAYFYGREVVHNTKWADTVSQAYVLDERQSRMNPGSHSLEYLCLQYFGIDIKALSNVNRKRIMSVPLPKLLTYNCLDAKYHRLLYFPQKHRLKDEGLSSVYTRHVRRVKAAVLTQLKGIPVDEKVVKQFYNRYTKRLDKIEAKIGETKTAKWYKRDNGEDFRPSANDDVMKVLHHLGEFPDNVDESVLRHIKDPLIKLVLRWRKNNKLRSTYVIPLVKDNSNSTLFPDGQLHPILTTTKTDTSRTSSEYPNCQNYPKRENKEVRSQVARKGYKVVSFDYGQIQARNVAMESGDKVLIKAFWDRYDIHSDWVWRIIDEYPSWVPGGKKALKADNDLFRHYRNKAKNEMVFPSFFGAQPSSLSHYLGVPVNKTKKLSEDFWEMFPGVKDWQDGLIDFYLKNAYVNSLAGYRRRAPISPNQLINAPIQADEAIIVLDAMVRLSELRNEKFQANMEIHDDLSFIWPDDEKEIEENSRVVIDIMLHTPFKWAHVVPLVVEQSIGDDWASTKEVGIYASDTWDGEVRLK